MKRFSKNKHHIKVDKLIYDENSQDITIYKGLPIISRKTCKIKDDDDENIQICKNEMFKVKRLANDMKTVDIVCQDRDDINFTLPTHLFNIYFKPAYCITVHSSQGLTIKEGITIHEFDRFDNRMKYVAISRIQNVNQLNFI
jgi:ATP-dependent exoDNAse (exonuclease V) alpha subunit